MVVWNPLAHNRTDVVTVHLDDAFAGAVVDADGTELPTADRARRALRELAGPRRPVAGLALLPLRRPARSAEWEPLPGDEIANEHYRLRVDPGAAAAAVSS